MDVEAQITRTIGLCTTLYTKLLMLKHMHGSWPDRLLARLQGSPDTASIAVLNQAAGGNRVLADGLGPNALGRIDRDVLAHSGVRYALIFEGVNDIGNAADSAQQAIGDRLIWAFSQMATRIHAQGIPIFGATITPFAGSSYSTSMREATRTRINNWIRTSGAFDGVVDFDAAVRSSSNPAQLDSRYNSGDSLHLNVAGYQAMADAVSLDLFTKFANGVSGAL